MFVAFLCWVNPFEFHNARFGNVEDISGLLLMRDSPEGSNVQMPEYSLWDANHTDMG